MSINKSFINVPFTLSPDGTFDEDAFLLAAEEAATNFGKQDALVSEEYVNAANEIINDPTHAEVKKWSPRNLTSMAITSLHKVPTAALVKTVEPRIKADLLSRTDEFLYIGTGRNAGFHMVSRYDEEALAKLVKNK